VPTPTPDLSAGQPAVAVQRPGLKFVPGDRFVQELRRRVDAYFKESGKRVRDCPAMYVKTFTILGAFIATYLVLLLVAPPWFITIPLAILMGSLMAGIGFNIQHDAGHRAYSDHQWVNKLMSMTLDLIGGSSYVWDWKHNSIHHTYPNIDGHDDDINIGLLGRLAPQQKRLWFHRFQGIYLWLLYGFLAIKWHFVDDFFNVIRGRIGEHKIKRPRGKELAIFIGGKIAFFSIAFGIPMLFHPILDVITIYCIAAISSGIVLSVVFQLAHCVDNADFPSPITTPEGLERMGTDWAVHQVHTTVNFSRRNPVLRWFLGGLNFQIEHHLFSRICHVHYPDLSKIVEEVCHEFGVRYQAHKSFFSALASHYRWLVEMGRPVSN
jgi:linoleoyl-CoA desaturase